MLTENLVFPNVWLKKDTNIFLFQIKWCNNFKHECEEWIFRRIVYYIQWNNIIKVWLNGEISG